MWYTFQGLASYKENFKLAFPIILSLSGQALVQLVDNMMVGQLGAKELAAVSLAGTIVMNVLMLGMGIAVSLTPIAGQAYALRNYKKASFFFQNSMVLNTLIGLFTCVILFVIFPFLHMMGQPQEVVEIAKSYYILAALSTLPYLIFLSFKQFMEGIGNTTVAMVITIACNLINVLLNYILIYGKWGTPAMGASGAALATLVARLVMPIVFYLYMSRKHPYCRFFSFFQWKHIRFHKQKKLLKIGLPISGQMVMEYFSLTSITIMMGWVGTIALAAYQIVISLAGFAFMVANGFAGAATVLVSHAFGQKNVKEIKRHAFTSSQMAVCFMGLAALAFLFFGEPIARGFTSDIEVIALAKKLLIVVVFFELFDGLQVSVLGSLRGMTDVKKPMIYAAAAYIFGCIPFAYVVGIVFDLGAVGVFSGFCVGLIIAGILLARRFFYNVKRFEKDWSK